MNEVVAEWVKKAEGDFAVAQREMRVRKNPFHDGVCFHCQQCVEKYIKGVLQDHGIHFLKIHDLPTLLNQCLSDFPLWEGYRQAFKKLTLYAVLLRYPGETATKAQARDAFSCAQEFRTEARRALGLKGS
ncbi:MAG: HEPN domain-containing protein [Planctomycetaceae bacterium]|nr:HEPN domain-containing protein [Planctomycetaceae bacterium]